MLTATSPGTLQADITRAANTGQGLLVPAGMWELPCPIEIPSTVAMGGEGGLGTIFKPSPEFVGDALFRLIPSASGYCQRVHLHDIYAHDPLLTGVAAVQAVAPSVLNCTFERIFTDTRRGLMLDTYTQACIINDLWAMSNADQVLALHGNANLVRGVDVEGASGTSPDPFVRIKGFSNLIEGVILEGTGCSAKTPLVLDGAPWTTLHHYWLESETLNDGYGLRILNSEGASVEDVFWLTPSKRIRIEASEGVRFSRIITGLRDWRSLIELVDGSSAIVEVVVGHGWTEQWVELRHPTVSSEA